MLVIENLKWSPGGPDIVSVPSLKVAARDRLLLLGPSGCGKTSLLNLMAGLLRPSAGDISFRDRRYSAMTGAELDRLRAGHFGFVFQKLHLIGHLTVAQNIALAQPRKDEGRIGGLIRDLGLEGRENRKARDLSVGEAQRVAVARAVANDPAIIFADEPTSALDDRNALAAMNLLSAQAEKTGAALVVATHDARIGKFFDKTLEMTA